MASILTNNSAMNALKTMRSVNSQMQENQDRISTGLKVSSGKDNAAYFSISKTMGGDSGMFKSIDEGLTLTQNSVKTARVGAENVEDLTRQFSERVAFAQSDAVDRAEVQKELDELAARVQTTIDQSTFNGNDLVSGAASTQTVITGISRAGGSFGTTSITFSSVNLQAIQSTLANINVNTTGSLSAALDTVEGALNDAIDAATSLGVAEKSIETQKDFLKNLTDTLDSGIGSMVDADMEEEAARSQSLQVQQQLATQSLSMANQQPQSLLSLFG
ncbi:flagellin [Salipiger sp. PrR003]|uniref:flagellin N-terminal helical domain-containing protein n=1 Tax=Salipiger sp. PrR003 TaxID=2706776 RepID=UPI0013DCDF1C|nr:flagellin [Salipiger sp. PrR003]NDV50785.1 flagellar protein [Salipiger sp. PrR003]